MVWMRTPWGEAQEYHLLKSPLSKMPACTLPPFGKWEVTGGGGDVDAMSSDGCPVHMLSEGEYNIHSSN